MCQNCQNNDDLSARMADTFLNLSVGERKKYLEGMSGTLCAVGKVLVAIYCENPEKNLLFLDHIGLLIGSKNESPCAICELAFLKMIIKVFLDSIENQQ